MTRTVVRPLVRRQARRAIGRLLRVGVGVTMMRVMMIGAMIMRVMMGGARMMGRWGPMRRRPCASRARAAHEGDGESEQKGGGELHGGNNLPPPAIVNVWPKRAGRSGAWPAR